MNWKFGIMLLVGAAVGGCYSPDAKSLSSDSAPNAIPAIKTAAGQNDRAAIPRLVDDLDDPDSAIRFAAITALRRMTGQDFGYRYYDSPWVRRPAVIRWRLWLKDNPSAANAS
jgi:hypothetical protein